MVANVECHFGKLFPRVEFIVTKVRAGSRQNTRVITGYFWNGICIIRPSVRVRLRTLHSANDFDVWANGLLRPGACVCHKHRHDYAEESPLGNPGHS